MALKEILFSSGFGFLLSFFFVYILIKSPLAAFFIDLPDERKVHQRIIPRVGGVGSISAFLLMLVVLSSFSPFATITISQRYASLFLISGVILLGLGLADDTTFRYMRVRYKLVIEFLLSAVVVIPFGICLSTINLFGWHLPLAGAGPVVTILWITGVANAFNIIDGVDGLAGGIAFFCFSTASLFFFGNGAGDLALISLLLAASSLGFLFQNIYPAKAFLGDTGALGYGFFIGVLSILVLTIPATPPPVESALLLTGLPVMDVFLSMARRYVAAWDQGESFKGRLHRMVIADNLHIHHRLIYRGFSHLQTTLLFYLLTITLCVSALLTHRLSPVWRAALLIYLAAGMAVVLRRFRFGNRLKRLFPKAMTSSHVHPSRMNLLILNHNNILFHSLKHFKQTTFTLHFLSDSFSPTICETTPFRAGILFHPSTRNIEDKYDSVLRHFADTHIPLIIVNDGKFDPQALRQKYPSLLLEIKGYPVYIPKLLSDIEALISGLRRHES